MFARFNLALNNEELKDEKCNGSGTVRYILQERVVRSCIDKYIDSDGELNAKAIEKDWFPEINANVFLSHAHEDEAVAKRLAVFLEENYGITSFIDSTVWGYANDLLKKIDEKYCVKKTKDMCDCVGNCIYDYEKRNQSTAHVHMILQGALSKMINRCECLIFLNTPNSLKVSDISKETNTASPWIYSELMMASTFPVKYYKEHRTSELMHFDAKFKYIINITDFVDISIADFIEAGKQLTIPTPEDVLEQLYLRKGLLARRNG